MSRNIKLAQIENGIVVNAIMVDPQNIPDFCADWPEITEGGKGWSFDGTSFTAPVEAVPLATEAEVRAEGARRLEALAAGYSREERETWGVQREEAAEVLADPAAVLFMLPDLAAPRGLTTAQFAQVVLYKSEALTIASAAILKAQTMLLATDPIPDDYLNDQHWS